MRFGKGEHINPVLRDLHWLPGEVRVEYNALLCTYKVYNNHAPSYINEMITKYEPRGTLRSGSKCMLVNSNKGIWCQIFSVCCSSTVE